jgi:hypothetical protein
MKRKRKIMVLALAILGGVILRSSPVEATLVTIEIEAVVDSVDDPFGYLEGNITPGDIITGIYTYDTDTPDSSPLPGAGRYEHYAHPSGFSLSVGGLDFVTDPANTHFLIEIVNNYPSDDGYGVVSYNNLPVSNGTSVNNISWALKDYSATALSSVELTTTAPVLTDWQVNYLNIGGGPGRSGFVFQAHVTSAVVIPEPSTILLLGFGTIALVRKVTK